MGPFRRGVGYGLGKGAGRLAGALIGRLVVWGAAVVVLLVLLAAVR